MKLNQIRLKLPTHVVDSAVTQGPRLHIGQSVSADLFHSVYKEQIDTSEPTDEKAIYLALHSKSDLPNISDIMLRNLRS